MPGVHERNEISGRNGCYRFVLIATSFQNVAASTITIYSFDWVSYFFLNPSRREEILYSSIVLSKENPKERYAKRSVKQLEAKQGEQERANALIDALRSDRPTFTVRRPGQRGAQAMFKIAKEE